MVHNPNNRLLDRLQSFPKATSNPSLLHTITQAIQGSVPGINVVNTGGVPGTNPTIRIRGVGSINASAAPLIIVDGAPFNGNLNSIAQEQVASISVLKDASSTALYGSRGANGVIIVTTKSGKKASPTPNFPFHGLWKFIHGHPHA